MNNIRIFCGICVGMLASLHAEEAARPVKAEVAKTAERSAQQTKIALINMQELMVNLQEYADSSAEMQRVVEERAKEVEAKEQRLAQQMQALERKRGMVQDEALQKEQRKLYELKTSIDFDKEELRAYVQNSQEMMNMSMQNKIYEAVDRVRKKQGWDGVLITPFPSSDRSNITVDVVELLNREYAEQKKKAAQKELPTPKTDADAGKSAGAKAA